MELSKIGFTASRRKISTIMKEYGLVSNYTVLQFKVHKTPVNEEATENLVEREFDNRKPLEVVASDLTYVNVRGKWNYIPLLIDLYNREIIGYATGMNKDAELVELAFNRVKYPLEDINLFHTDRGNEFKNKIIDEILSKANIKRSLSKKGCPYDNAVAEATYKIFKTEFIYNQAFQSIEELDLKLFEYINWYNNRRIHGSLGYISPVVYREISREKTV